MEDVPGEIAGIIPTPCISLKEEAKKTDAAVMIDENLPEQKKSWQINLQAQNQNHSAGLTLTHQSKPSKRSEPSKQIPLNLLDNIGLPC